MCDFVSEGDIFIILFSFPLSLEMCVMSASSKNNIWPYSIYISFMTAGSCSFAASENLKCVKQRGCYNFTFSSFYLSFQGKHHTLPKTCHKCIFKNLLNYFRIGISRRSNPKIPENLKNNLGAGGSREPNISGYCLIYNLISLLGPSTSNPVSGPHTPRSSFFKILRFSKSCL